MVNGSSRQYIEFWICNVLFLLTGFRFSEQRAFRSEVTGKSDLCCCISGLKHQLCLYSAPWKLMKGHVSSCHCDVKGVCVCVCVRLRLRVSHECAWRWVRQWLGFAAAWGEQKGAETSSDSRYHQLQTSPVIPQQHDGPVLYQDPETLLRLNFYQRDDLKSLFLNEKGKNLHDILHIWV